VPTHHEDQPDDRFGVHLTGGGCETGAFEGRRCRSDVMLG
jgi:hypothetical protein